MSIFLSYRRADSAHALWLYPWLIQWFGREEVFWDRKDIEPGADFAETIESRIRSSKAFVALLSTNWLSARDEQGRRRIDSPADWIRRETALALSREMVVIPVLLGGMKAPAVEELPVDLQGIARLHMLPMADPSFHDLLRERLEKVIPCGTPGPGAGSEETARLQRRAGTLLRRQIQRLQLRASELIDDGKVDRATEELNEGYDLLMTLLDLLPGDTVMDAQLGYLFGTTSQSWDRAGNKELARLYRDLAVSVFERLRADPALPPSVKASAINGIGGAYSENDDPVTAMEYHRAALEIEPSYCYAWHDLFVAYDRLARRGAINLTGMREGIDKARETGEGLPGLSAAHFETMERLFRGWQQRLVAEPFREVNDGVLRLVPRALVLVVAEASPGAAIFNLNCDIIHQVSTRVTLQNLEVEVTTPEGYSRHFRWNVFYDFQPSHSPWGRRMTSLGDAHEIEIAAGSSSLGVQFVASGEQPGWSWSPGRYKFALRAQLTKKPGDEQFDADAAFSADIGHSQAADVHSWSRATKEEWDRLGILIGPSGFPW